MKSIRILIEPERGLLIEKSSHFHLEDIAPSRKHHHLMPGEGAIDIPGVLETIEATGFAGFVTVELYTYEEQAIVAARDAFDYLRRWRSRGTSENRAKGV